MTQFADPLPLARALIRKLSVTPADDGAIDLLIDVLSALGFTCHDLTFESAGVPIRNLYARLGDRGPNFCFAGHTDVVPAGEGWSVDPFGADVHDGKLFGRGAADMKGAIAAFVAAVARFLGTRPPNGSLSLLITGDEEARAIDGTAKVLDWLRDRGETLDACLVGEPSNPVSLGDAIKIGRRGSLNARLSVFGTQGHSAYPQLSDNPIPRLLDILHRLTEKPMDEGSPHFQPSTLALTTIDVGNPTTNVTPALAKAGFNIRFNDRHGGASIERWIRGLCEEVGGRFELSVEVTGESFVTPVGPLSDAVVAAVQAETGRTPDLCTRGGTSDARFISRHCPVVEFGLVNATIHKTDEHIAVADLETLTRIYRGVLERMV